MLNLNGLNSHAKSLLIKRSILTENITTWFVDGRKAPQQLIKPAQNIIGTHLPRISNIG